MVSSRNAAFGRRRAWKTCREVGRPRQAGNGKPAGTAESPVSNGGALPFRGARR